MTADKKPVSDIREHDDEPLLGLPERLPEGERLLWQGSPNTWGLVRHVLHVNKVVLWFALIGGWRLVNHWQQTGDWSAALLKTPTLALVAALGIIFFIAWLYAGSTVYTLTNRRVTMRFGIAVQITMNIPFSKIHTADVSQHGGDTGNIAFKVDQTARISHLVLWPNVRPWHWMSPRPMLCCVSGLSRASSILNKAVSDYAVVQNKTGHNTGTLNHTGIQGV